MKKFFGIISLVLVCMLLFTGFTPAENNQINISEDKASIIIDTNTGEVVYEKESEKKLQVASIVKLMTTLISIEEIEKGNLNLDDTIVASENAAGMGGSQVFIDAFSSYSVKDMLKSVIIASANDASVALAEHIAGSEENFVNLMNKRASELGLNNTLYANSTGLPMPEEYSCAKDVAMLLKEVVKHQIYHDFCNIWMDELVHPSGRKTELVNTNKLVRYYKGCNGGKTGFTDEAGYCLSASAEKGNLKFIAVSLGAKDAKTRFSNVTKLLEYAFNNFETQLITNSQIPVKNQNIKMAKQEKVDIFFEKDYYMLSKKGEKSDYDIVLDIDKNIKAPLKQNDCVGKATITKNGKVIEEINLIVNQNIEKIDYKHALKQVISNWK